MILSNVRGYDDPVMEQNVLKEGGVGVPCSKCSGVGSELRKRPPVWLTVLLALTVLGFVVFVGGIERFPLLPSWWEK